MLISVKFALCCCAILKNNCILLKRWLQFSMKAFLGIVCYLNDPYSMLKKCVKIHFYGKW